MIIVTIQNFVQSSTNEVSKLLKVSLTLSDNTSSVEQYQCLVQMCLNTQDACEQINHYQMIIPDVINGRIAQRPNVFYYHWYKPSSAVKLQITGDQLNCDNTQFYWLTDHDNLGQLIVSYVPSVMVHIVQLVNCSVNVAMLQSHILCKNPSKNIFESSSKPPGCMYNRQLFNYKQFYCNVHHQPSYVYIWQYLKCSYH